MNTIGESSPLPDEVAEGTREPTTQSPIEGEAQGGGNLDKVRDILFGAQSREYEKRFSRLEERLAREAEEFKSDLKKRFDSLEIYIKKEIESLTDRLTNEQTERADSVKNLSRDLKELNIGLEKRIGQLDEQTTKTQRELRQQILDQYKSLTDDMQNKHQEISLGLDQALQELRTEKTDRASLASLFMEAAMRLNNEFKIPTGK